MLPGVQPRLGDHREPGAPLLVERLELGLGLVGVDGGVDRLQIAGDLLALAPRHVLQAEADQVNLWGRPHNVHYADLPVMPTWERKTPQIAGLAA